VAPSEHEPSPWRALGRVGMLGTTLVAATVVGLVLGYWLDRWLGTTPWLTMVFAVFGIVAAFLNLFRDLKKYGQW